MHLQSSLAKLLGSSLFRWTGAAALIGLFSLAGGCDGCDDSSLVCDPSGQNCRICDAYGCRPADPNVGSGGSGGGAHASSSSSSSGGPSCDQSKTTCPCGSSSDCQNGLSCVNGLCIDACQFSYECGAGNVCINGTCAPGCDAQTTCAVGYTCDKGACVPDPKNPQCTDKSQCPSGGYICVNGLCTTGCSVNADCSPGTICDSTTHGCIVDPSPKPACNNQVKCTGVGQICLPDGYCHYPCQTLNDCIIIDSRFVVCDANVCKTQEEVKPECGPNKACTGGLTCISGKCL